MAFFDSLDKNIHLTDEVCTTLFSIWDCEIVEQSERKKNHYCEQITLLNPFSTFLATEFMSVQISASTRNHFHLFVLLIIANKC